MLTGVGSDVDVNGTVLVLILVDNDDGVVDAVVLGIVGMGAEIVEGVPESVTVEIGVDG